MAPTKTQALIALLGMSSVNSQDTSDNVITCYEDSSKTFFMGGVTQGGLQDGTAAPKFKNAVCCAGNTGTSPCDFDCTEGAGFCASGVGGLNPINNRFLKEFLWPADQTNCPDDTNIELTATGTTVKKKHFFQGSLPNTNARNWHCKWKVSAPTLATAPLSDTDAARAGNGWIQLQVNTKGFDKNTVVIMQPPEKFYDFNFRDITNNPEKATYVGLSATGRTYVFPAEYDVFIDVSPYAYKKDTDEDPTNEGEGFAEIVATHFASNPMPAKDADGYSTWSEAERLPALGGAVEEIPEGPDPDAADIDLVEPVDNSEIPDEKKDSDGNVISVGEKWGTRSAFTIGDTTVTNEQVTKASGVVVILIIIIVVMCLFFSWIERKKIAEEGRRLSTAVRRASTKLRRGSSATDAPEKEMTDKDIEKAAGKAAGSKGEKNFLQDQMKYQRDAQMASQTSIQGEDAAGGITKNKSIDGLPKPDGSYKDPVE